MPYLARALRAVLLALLVLGLAGEALANDHGGGGGGSDLITMETFTTNLAPETGGESRFIQIAISLRLSDASGAAAINAYMPQIRNDILLVLCAHSGSELQQTEARKALAEEVKDVVNGVVGTPAQTDKKGRRTPAEGPVKSALFTSFIVQ